MNKLNYIFLFLLLAPLTVNGQTLADYCHVYVINETAAKQAAGKYPTGNAQEDAKLLSTGITILGRFSPTLGEEVLTTKSFKLPDTDRVITASVFYTDEMMFSSKLKTQDSMLIGIVVSKKAFEEAFSMPYSATAEVTYSEHTDTVRVKTRVNINSRQFLVGLECRTQQEFDPTDPKQKKP